MSARIFRSIAEEDRAGISWDQKWKGPDQGLIVCWEVGRKMRTSNPELAEKAKKGELPVLEWKGGVDKKLQKAHKYGTLHYLAQWQGLRGADLDIDLSSEVEMTCKQTGMRITFTSDSANYLDK